MIKIFLLALRNIFRNKRRTALTFFAIISGTIALIVFGGYVEYSFWGLRESTIRSQLGHIQIYKKGYSEHALAAPFDYLITNYPEIEKYLRTLPFIEIITPQLSTSGLISSGERTLNCIIKGVEPATESKLASFESIIEGEDLSSYLKEPCVVIGNELRKSFGVKIGEYLTLLTTTVDGSINAADVKLVGVCQSMSKEYDSVIVKLPIQNLQNLLNTTSIEKILLLLDRTENTDTAASMLMKTFKEKNLNLEIKRWDELATFYKSVVRLYTGIFNVMKIIIAAIVFFSIANTMIMSIFERFREIGTLRAIGTKKIMIVFMFVLEGFLMGLIGGLLGIISGVVVAKIINLSGGIYIPPPPGLTTGYTAFILIVPKVLIYSYTSTLIVSMTSSIYPAIRAANLNIVDALRYV